ncbi:hypothetical protein [Saccharomonospora glauca]|jgi:hypothetical protein|uniref:Uncharacterized protein n=1 Tax=Saccharomonospora glauca K62 TaxID=928724 RepID=I1D408_9PSEU|nr:hypothetical protein [Saccharomonospora glauca]EIE99682.1 hypothetical protein SacglDRAFT_02797 [Saccharomonospora glauca K62]
MTTTENGAEQPDATRLVEEVRLLVDLVLERARPWLDGVIAAGHGRARDEENPAACDDRDRCPLCAVVALCRGERVDVAARVLEHVTQLLALLRAVLADRWEPEDGVHLPGFRPSPRKPEPEKRRGRRVQHVTVRPRDRWEPDARDRD